MFKGMKDKRKCMVSRTQNRKYLDLLLLSNDNNKIRRTSSQLFNYGTLIPTWFGSLQDLMKPGWEQYDGYTENCIAVQVFNQACKITLP